jgi:Na+/proline symporter
VSVVLALVAVGFSFGFGSMVFILLTLAFAIFLAVYAFSLWCLRSNLKDSMSLLQEIRSQKNV